MFCYSQMQSGNYRSHVRPFILPLIARFMGPTWGPAGTDRTQVGPMLAPWTLLSGSVCQFQIWPACKWCLLKDVLKSLKKDEMLQGKPSKEFDNGQQTSSCMPMMASDVTCASFDAMFWFDTGWLYPYYSGLLHCPGAIIWLSQCQWSNPR